MCSSCVETGKHVTCKYLPRWILGKMPRTVLGMVQLCVWQKSNMQHLRCQFELVSHVEGFRVLEAISVKGSQSCYLSGERCISCAKTGKLIACKHPNRVSFTCQHWFSSRGILSSRHTKYVFWHALHLTAVRCGECSCNASAIQIALDEGQMQEYTWLVRCNNYKVYLESVMNVQVRFRRCSTLDRSSAFVTFHATLVKYKWY